jgi:hypothetical protein
MDDLATSLSSARWRRLLPVSVPVILAHVAALVASAGVNLSHAETPAPARAPAVAVRVVDGPAPAPAVAETPAAPAAPVKRTTGTKPVAEPHKITAPTATDAPVYRTRIPPSTVLRYAISRGPWSGNGELTWELLDGNRYHARLEGRVAGIKVLTQDSTGLIDNAGVAPVRFTDERRGKSVMAANFQRSAGKITYSGPSNEYNLVPGTQDRLTWMVQIGAIAAADPKGVAAGKRISMYVTGARGDADVWTFQAIGVENVPIGGVSVSAIKLVREPRKVNDTLVEVWLDPQLHHLPVRARMTNQPEGETFELLRRPSDPS